MSSRRVLVVTSSYPPSRGGVERHVEEVVRELQARGWYVRVLVRPGDGHPRGRGAVLDLPASTGRRALGAWLVRHPDLARRWDVVHTHDVDPRPLQRLVRAGRWVHTFHGYEGYPPSEGSVRTRREVARAVDSVVHIGAYISRWYGTAADLTLYGGVHPAPPAKGTREFDVVVAGRLAPDTGVQMYAGALAGLHQEGRGLSALFLGDGPLRPEVEAQLAHGECEFAGIVDDVVGGMRRARVAAVSGYLGILEAASLGMPPVSVYDNPLKQDYLQCHPLGAALRAGGSITETKELLLAAVASARGPDPALLGWSRQHSWRAVVDAYLELYDVRPVGAAGGLSSPRTPPAR